MRFARFMQRKMLLPLGGDGTKAFQEGHEVAQVGQTAEDTKKAEGEVSHVTEGFDVIPSGTRLPDGYEFDKGTNVVKYTNWYGQKGQVARNSYDVGQLGENLLKEYLGGDGSAQQHMWTEANELRKIDFFYRGRSCS